MIRVCIYTYHKDFLVTWYTQIHPTERYVEQRLPRKNFPKNPAWKLPHNPKIDIYILFRQTFLPKLQKTPWKSARHQKMVVHHTPHTPALGGPSCSRRCLLLRRQRLLPPLRRAIACGVMGGARVKRTTNGWKGSDEGWNPMYHHIWRTGKLKDGERQTGWGRRRLLARWKWWSGLTNGYFISKLKRSSWSFCFFS